ncbi:energy transducer TonB [Hymenobacter cellulosilyticus]|uniref:Energy transducer TonB n=1 Tax=Hymenobacter cellulosilyticus TaxID=2932248 RepID=A0A8T9Q8L3_9BACT|nr:energy transducer TonB [Hymenobacter cellulosilyticus]UOQ72428.1 energy transducer TonB [Hymenobacter cellulosilyticus]
MRSTVRRLTLLLALSTAALTTAHAQQKLKYPKTKADEIYDVAAKPAVPTTGLQGYADYLEKNQQYPTAALQNGKEGTVEVTFVVEKSGGISNIAVKNALDPALDAEAMRLIKGGPKWVPAENKGEKVRQRVTVPISFHMPLGAGGPAPQVSDNEAGADSKPADGPKVIKPEQPARPVGGIDAFFEWIQKNQKYPALARKKNIQGKVMVEFMVQPDGSLTDVKLVKRLGAGLDEEALRLIKAAPKWEPAMYQGKPVKQKMVLPVLFQLL